MIDLRKIPPLLPASALLFALCAYFFGVTVWVAQETSQHSREIEKSFFLASAVVEEFKKTNGRLPTRSEFTAWADTQPDRAYSAKHLRLLVVQSQFPDEIVKKFGAPPYDGYIIEMWRGEWFEYFVSWKNDSTLEPG